MDRYDAEMSDGWTSVIALADLVEGKATTADLDGTTVLLYRNAAQIFAIGNRCSHQGAPLHRGPVHVGGSEATVTCQAHGSIFGLEDGRVMRGPATQSVPAYDARVMADMVELRPR